MLNTNTPSEEIEEIVGPRLVFPEHNEQYVIETILKDSGASGGQEPAQVLWRGTMLPPRQDIETSYFPSVGLRSEEPWLRIQRDAAVKEAFSSYRLPPQILSID